MDYSDRMTSFARLGFAARGLVYIMIGVLAFDASRTGAQANDNQGALGSLADTHAGRILLAFCALGFAGYAIWRFTEAVMDPERKGHDLKGSFERAAYVISGVANASLAIVAAKLALQQSRAGSGSPGDARAESWSGWLMEQPGGVLLLVLVGVGFFATAVTQAIKAYKASFDNLNGDVPAPKYVRWVGRLGYGARAIVFAIIGWLIVSAALNHDPEQAGGLGDALDKLRSQPEGAVILAIVGIGLALFGAFSLVEARYRRIRVVKPHISI